MSLPDFLPTANLEALAQRATIIGQLRHFFDGRGFVEVETPIVSNETVIDHHVHPIRIAPTGADGEPVLPGGNAQLWLQTSPELGMKRLLAAGATAIYQITKSFRAGESGRVHNPEFTMLEWYRVGDDMNSGMKLLAELAETTLSTQPTEFISYRDLFLRFVDIDPFAASTGSLEKIIRAHEIELTTAEDRSQTTDLLLNVVLSQIIEPRLGLDCPQVVYDWPSSQSALAIVRPGLPSVAERFELYVGGMEIANGYHELLDAEELERRNEINNGLRQREGFGELPRPARLLAAMEHGLPPCSGVALGVDRLVMLAIGAKSIDEVIAFPMDRA